MIFDTSDVIKEVVADAPAALKLLLEAVDIFNAWKNGDQATKDAAEALAQAKLGTMTDARNQTQAAHDERTKETEAILDAKEHPAAVEPPKVGE